MNKFDCLVNEILHIQDLEPAWNVQSDSLRAKVFMQLACRKFGLTQPLHKPLFIINYVTLTMAPDAPKRRFLSLIFLVSCTSKSFLIRIIIVLFFLPIIVWVPDYYLRGNSNVFFATCLAISNTPEVRKPLKYFIY